MLKIFHTFCIFRYLHFCPQLVYDHQLSDGNSYQKDSLLNLSSERCGISFVLIGLYQEPKYYSSFGFIIYVVL